MRTSTKQFGNPARRRGFSLIDVTIAMLVLGVVASVTVPRFSTALTSSQLNAAVTRITADFSFARSQAMHRSEAVTVSFLTEPSRYSISPVKHPDRRPGDYVVNATEIEGTPTFTGIDFNGTTAVTFNIHGVPSAGSVTH